MDSTLHRQLKAVKRDGYAIKNISNPSLDVQLAAVKTAPRSIGCISNPSLEAQLEAIRLDIDVLEYISNPSLDVQLAAVKQCVSAIYLIPNPSPEILELVLKKYVSEDKIIVWEVSKSNGEIRIGCASLTREKWESLEDFELYSIGGDLAVKLKPILSRILDKIEGK